MNTQTIILAKLNRDRNVWEVFNIQGERFGEFNTIDEVKAHAPHLYRARYNILNQTHFIFFNEGEEYYGIV